MDLEDLSAWPSYEALEECIRRDTPKVAKALRLGPSMIQKWKEPPATDDDFQSGARNPLDRIAETIQTIEKIDPERAYVPLMWLCAHFGFMPPVKMPTAKETDKDILKAILKWHEEFGETCSELSKALDDGKITTEEYKKVFREAMEDIGALMTILGMMKERAEANGVTS